MAKAKLVTRSATTSTVTDDNLNKASALTHAEMDSNLINLRDSSFGIADDTSTVLQVSDDKTITIAGGSGISTAISGDTLTITASESQNVFNTISVAGQSDVVADATTDTLTLVAGNDISITTDAGTDTITIASTASGTITALNNQAENRLTTIGSTTTELDGEANLTFDGSTLAITGGLTATTSIANDAVSIDDNKITATRSNDNLFISANGTGAIHIAGDDSNLFDSTLYDNIAGTPNLGNTIIATVETVDAGSVPDRSYNSIISHNTTLTGSGTASNFRPRGISGSSNIDLAGYSYTNSSFSRGPNGANIFAQAENSGAGASTLATLSGIATGAYIQDYSNHNQDITVDNAIGIRTGSGIENAGTGALTMTNVYDFYANAYTDNQSSGSSTITNHYAFYTPGTGGTNNYAFYSNSDTAESRLGTIERYRETINSLTSSSTITVDCGLAPVHTVTLGVNTQFVISNLGTGQSVTIIITNGASYTASFGTDASTAVKFPGGAPTLTASGIDAVTIFNDGTNYLGNIAQAYA
jgi:hypothetical protein